MLSVRRLESDFRAPRSGGVGSWWRGARSPIGMTHEDPKVEAFIRRVMAAAPDLTEEEVENIRRCAAGELPPEQPRRRTRPRK
jgi:hypothetical protein